MFNRLLFLCLTVAMWKTSTPSYAEDHRWSNQRMSLGTIMLPGGERPLDLIPFNSDELCVSCDATKVLLILEGPSLSVRQRITMPVLPGFLSINPSGTHIFITSFYDPGIWMLDTKTLYLSRLLEADPGAKLSQFEVSEDEKSGYVADIERPDLYIFDLQSKACVQKVKLSGPAYSVCVDRSCETLYVGTKTGEVQTSGDSTDMFSANGVVGRVDVVRLKSSPLIAQSISVPGAGIIGMCLAGNRLYVVSVDGGNLSAIDTMSGSLMTTPGARSLNSGGSCQDVLLDSDDDELFVTVEDPGLVCVRPDSFQTVSTARLGEGRMRFGVLNGVRVIFVASFASRSITVINIKGVKSGESR